MNLSLPINDPPDLETQRLSRVDGCPRCLDYNTPVRVTNLSTMPGCFIADYRCPCGQSWTTSWTDA